MLHALPLSVVVVVDDQYRLCTVHAVEVMFFDEVSRHPLSVWIAVPHPSSAISRRSSVSAEAASLAGGVERGDVTPPCRHHHLWVRTPLRQRRRSPPGATRSYPLVDRTDRDERSESRADDRTERSEVREECFWSSFYRGLTESARSVKAGGVGPPGFQTSHSRSPSLSSKSSLSRN